MATVKPEDSLGPGESIVSNDSSDKRNELYARIRSVQYPVSGQNDHFVRFFINLNEESRLIRERADIIDADPNALSHYENQNRASRNSTDENLIKKGKSAANLIGTVGGGIVGAKAGANVGVAGAKAAVGLKNLFFKKKSKLGSGAIVGAAVLGGAAGGVAGALVGKEVTELVTDSIKLSSKLKRLAASITLYAPGNIRTSHNMQYEMSQNVLVDLAQQDQLDALTKGISSLTSMESAAQTREAARKTLGAGVRIIASTNSTVSILSRTAVNPKKDIMFQEVSNRTFAFSYTFAPRDADEAKEVADIIFLFKYFAHPEMLKGYGNFLYLYPAEFDIKYYYRDENNQEVENTNLNKISSCVLINIDVNYAPNGSYQSLENGEPIITSVDLVFKEIEALHRDRIGDGY